MRFTFFGGYDPDYPRNAVIRKGLAINGAAVAECRGLAPGKFWARFPALPSASAAPRTSCSSPSSARRTSPGRVPRPPLAEEGRLRPARLALRDQDHRLGMEAGRFPGRPVEPPHRQESVLLGRPRPCRHGGPQKLLLRRIRTRSRQGRGPPHRIRRRSLSAGRRSLGTGLRRTSGRRVRSPVLWIVRSSPRGGGDRRGRARRRRGGSVRPLHAHRRRPDVRETRDAAAGLTNVAFIERMPGPTSARDIDAADVSLGIFGRTDKARRASCRTRSSSPWVWASPDHGPDSGRGGVLPTRKEHLYYCDEPLAESLAAAVMKLKDDAALRERIARATRAGREKYTADSDRARLLDIREPASDEGANDVRRYPRRPVKGEIAKRSAARNRIGPFPDRELMKTPGRGLVGRPKHGRRRDLPRRTGRSIPSSKAIAPGHQQAQERVLCRQGG